MKLKLLTFFASLLISSTAQAACYQIQDYSICEFEKLTCVTKIYYPQALSCFSTKNWRQK